MNINPKYGSHEKLKNQELIGCIILERSGNARKIYNFLGTSIRFVMKMFGKVSNIENPDPVYNHSENIVWDDEIGLSVVGAISGGVEMRPFLSYLPESRWKDIIVLKPKIPFTLEEKKKFSIKAKELALNTEKYEYIIFLKWIFYVLTFKKIWVGKDDTPNKFYCFELSARLAKYIRNDLFDNNSEITSYYEISRNKNYEEFIDWKNYL